MPLELGSSREPARSSNRPPASSIGPAPSSTGPVPSSLDPARAFREGTLSEEEAIRRYRNIVVARMGSVSAAAGRLGVHRNTVTRSLDHARLARWKARRAR